jgi:two-component system, sensor histidine kinase
MLTPDLVVAAASDAYLKATMTRREEVIGRPIFGVLPSNPGGPVSTAEADLRASVARVIARGPDKQPMHKFDIRRTAGVRGASYPLTSAFHPPTRRTGSREHIGGQERLIHTRR